MSGRPLYQIWNREKTRKFRRLLLKWYRRNKRRLPWRSNPTPYRVWIAEIMLQQTRVRAVLPYYELFLERFPDVASLAAAGEEDVLAAWAGLGYYARARNLRRAARQIVREFGGRMPRDTETLRRLPGIGRYTAGAICSIAFNQPQPIVDGNVRRVIQRLDGGGSRIPERFVWQQAAKLVSASRASDFNQALMELGALLCVPAKPLCPSCPVRSLCLTNANGIDIPRSNSVKSVRRMRLVVLAIQYRCKIVVSDQSPAPYIPGKWSLPTRVLESGKSPARTAASLTKKILHRGMRVQECRLVRHSITWRRILAHIFRIDLRESPGIMPEGYGLVKIPEAKQRLTSSLYRKALEEALASSAALLRRDSEAPVPSGED